MKISTLIIDDEALARQRLVNLIKDVPELNLIGQSSTGKDAISKINELEPDVIVAIPLATFIATVEELALNVPLLAHKL